MHHLTSDPLFIPFTLFAFTFLTIGLTYHVLTVRHWKTHYRTMQTIAKINARSSERTTR